MDVVMQIATRDATAEKVRAEFICLKYALYLARKKGIVFDLGEKLISDINDALVEIDREIEKNNSAVAGMMKDKQVWG